MNIRIKLYRLVARVLDLLRVKHKFWQRAGWIQGGVTRKNRGRAVEGAQP